MHSEKYLRVSNERREEGIRKTPEEKPQAKYDENQIIRTITSIIFRQWTQRKQKEVKLIGK